MDKSTVEHYHKKYTGFFTGDECKQICDIIKRDKNLILSYTDIDDNQNGYEGLTRSFTVYNWLYHPDIQPLNIPCLLYTSDAADE